MEQILEARTDEDAAKLLHECGYPELDASRPEAMDAALSAARRRCWRTWPAELRTPGISIYSS